MFTRNVALIACVAAVAAALTATSSQAGMAMTNVNYLTFSHAVALPGVTLPAGRTYTFESGPGGSDRNIVRVLNVSRQKLLFLGFTRAIERPAGVRDHVSLGEAPVGEPTPIAVWYPNGSDRGHEFLYR